MLVRFLNRNILFLFFICWVACLDGPGGFIFSSTSTNGQSGSTTEEENNAEDNEVGTSDIENNEAEEPAPAEPQEPASDNQTSDNSTATDNSTTSDNNTQDNATEIGIDNSTTAELPTRWLPKPLTTWQWQLQGTIDTSFAVDAYDIDLFDSDESTIQALHDQGRKVICYLSAGSWENWRPDQFSFPQFVKGKALDDWPGELWLDISQMDVLQPIMETRMDLAQAKGCDAVEPDNLDGYTQNSGFKLTAADQLAYNTMLATIAHERDLSIALKNDLGQVNDLVGLFDFAINESCFQFNECQLLAPFINANKAVLVAEYNTDPATFCPLALAMRLSAMKKKTDLKAEVLATCW